MKVVNTGSGKVLELQRKVYYRVALRPQARRGGNQGHRWDARGTSEGKGGGGVGMELESTWADESDRQQSRW